MDKFKALQFFILVAQRGSSFIEAAKIAGTSASTISKAITRLEQELGCQLFLRTTRKLNITQSGLDYLNTVKGMLDDLDACEAQIISDKSQPQGVINLNLPVSYGKLYILPLLKNFNELYPAISFNIQFNDAYVDMIEQNIDVTIRSGTIQDSRLICQKLSPIDFLVCASRNYISANGPLKSENDAYNHRWIRFRFRQTGKILPIFFVNGENVNEINPGNQFVVDDGESMAELCAAGLGLTQTPHFIARKWLDKGEIEAVYPCQSDEQYGVYLLYTRRDYMPARVRVFIDYIKQSIRDLGETPQTTWARNI